MRRIVTIPSLLEALKNLFFLTQAVKRDQLFERWGGCPVTVVSWFFFRKQRRSSILYHGKLTNSNYGLKHRHMDSAIHSPFVFVTHALNRTNMYITLFIMVTKPTSVQACSCRLDLRLSALVLVCQKQHREPLPAAWNHKGNPAFEIPALETSWNADSMTCCVDVNSRNPGNSWDAGGLESRQGGVCIGEVPRIP